MATILILIIYMAFISLGLPDALLGAVWPAAHLDLGAPVSGAGLVSAVITCGTVLSSLLSSRMIARFGTGRVAAASVVLTAGGLIGISFTNSFIGFCLLAVPLGLGGGAVDAALNNYVAVHYGARQMNFLHSFWGVGATVGPLILSSFIRLNDWHGGYRCVGFIQTGIAALMLASIPLWRRVAARDGDASPVTQTERSARSILKKPGVPEALVVFLLYCAGEMTAGLWSGTYLVSAHGFAPERAARWTSLFYFGLMAGRMLSGIFASAVSTVSRMRIGRILALCGAALLMVPGAPDVLRLLALPALGVGCAPIFPGMIQLTPKRYGADCSQTLIGLEMAASYIGSSAMPPLFGLIANATTFKLLPYVLLFYFACMTLYMRRLEKRFISGT